MPTALRIAEDLAAGPRHAIAATKRTLNHWVRAASPIFESSLAMEMLGFFSDDAREGYAAMREKRRPKFPSNLGTES
jgi:enoyl-CoA hydratase